MWFELSMRGTHEWPVDVSLAVGGRSDKRLTCRASINDAEEETMTPCYFPAIYYRPPSAVRD